MSESDIFRTDFYFDVTSTGDIDRVSGLTNLREAIFRRLITTPGTLVHRPTYGVGIKRFQNDLNRLSKKKELASLIQEQISQDERVVSVLGVLISEDPSNSSLVNINIRVEAVGIGEVNFSYQVGDLP